MRQHGSHKDTLNSSWSPKQPEHLANHLSLKEFFAKVHFYFNRNHLISNAHFLPYHLPETNTGNTLPLLASKLEHGILD